MEHDLPLIGRRTMILNARRIYREGNKTEMILLAIEDITERRRAERRTEKLNGLLASLGPDFLENMERIMEAGREIMDADIANYYRKDRGKVFCALSSLPGKELGIVEDPENYLCGTVFSASSPDPVIMEDLRETRFRDSDPYVKEHGMSSFLGYPVILQGDIVGCLSFFTREKRRFGPEETGSVALLSKVMAAEEERLAREESLKNFIDVASHELRHPATIMKGYAVSLRDLWKKLDENKRREMLDAIDHGAERLAKVVSELLDVTRIERARFQLRKKKARLKPLVEEAVSQMRGKGMKNPVHIDMRDDAASFYLDPEKLVELLIILLDNAVEYSPPLSPIDIEAELRGGEALVSVLDRGQGVPGEYRERIFERFFQVEEAVHHSKPGIGLGLYIAREIVEAHGGKIWCEPRGGGGSIFRFTLP